MLPMLSPTNYLKKVQQYEKYMCSYCFLPSLDIFQCQGPCRKYYCIRCLDNYISYRFRCKYCQTGENFQFKEIKMPKLQFICPNSSDCQTQINSLQQFKSHYSNCLFISSQDADLLNNRINYRCKEGHELIFLSIQIADRIYGGYSFNNLTNSKCKMCHQITLCRSFCQKCSKQQEKVVFCSKCMPLPVTKTKCPLDHNLQRRIHKRSGSTCDCCGYRDKFSNQCGYVDNICNFDICARCHHQLSQKNELIPIKNICQNKQKEHNYAEPDINDQ